MRLVVFLSLLVTVSARARTGGDAQLGQRLVTAAQAVTEDVLTVFEWALQPDTIEVDWLRGVQQRGVEGALLATHVSTAIDVGVLRADPCTDPVLSEDEVQLDACSAALSDFGRAIERMPPMQGRVRELAMSLRGGLAGEDD